MCVRTHRAMLFRVIPSLAALALYIIFAFLRTADYPVYEALVRIPIGYNMPQPFGDLGAILQAGTCWRQGVNVYLANACMHGGNYNYSPFLLRAAYLPIGMPDEMAGGVLFGLGFIATLACLPAPDTITALLLRLAAALSTTTVIALEQANFDIVIYCLTLLGLWLLLRNSVAALAGYGIFIFAATLKFYPVFLLGLALRESLRRLLAIAVMALVIFKIYSLYFAAGTATAIEIIPKGSPFTILFGAINLPFGLVLLRFLPHLSLDPAYVDYHATVTQPFVLQLIAQGKRIFCLIALTTAIFTASRYTAALRTMPPAELLCLLAGSLLTSGCFFLAQNVDYRAIFLILTIPGLSALIAQRPAPPATRAKFLAGCIIFLLWGGLVRSLTAGAGRVILGRHLAIYPEIAFWFVRELAWWWVVIQLCAIIISFTLINVANLFAEKIDESPARG